MLRLWYTMTTSDLTPSKHELLRAWFPLKEERHNLASTSLPKIKNGDVWWTAVGENVGVEINGKSDYFSRPVLVFKKLSRLGFLGLPLSTQNHRGSWYVNLDFQSKRVCVVLAQARVFSTARLYSRLGQLTEVDMTKVVRGFRELYLGD